MVSAEHTPESSRPEEHLLTPANVMTALRPIGAAIAMVRLWQGQPRASWIAGITALTDREGDVARFVDTHQPESGRGATEFGKLADPVADTMAMLELGAGIMASPRASRLAKVGVALTIADEAEKAAWAFRADRRHRQATGEKLVLDVTNDGKRGTAFKLIAGGLATLTHDLKPSRTRDIVSALTPASALLGIYFSRKARREYNQRLVY